MLRRSLVLVVFAAFVMPARAGNETLVVNSTLDLPDADSFDGVCDADLETEGQQITLRAAIMFANVQGGDDAIEVPAGLYKLTLQGFDEDEGATGDLDITDNLTITGDGRLTTIVDGKKAKDRVFDIATGATVEFDGFTIRKGSAPTKNVDDQRGGGIRNEGDLSLVGMTIAKCKTGDADGGGISHAIGSLVVVDSILSKNSSKDDGGGVDLASGFADFTRVSFVKNKAKGNGGGLECSPAEAVVVNCTFSGNKAGATGGALSIKEGSTVSVLSCTLAKNKGKLGGSGLAEDTTDGEDDAIEMANCIVSNKATTNYAGDGLTSLGSNLDSGPTCGFGAPGDLQDQDPRLVKLSNDPEELPVHRLKPDSPCIDAGDDVQCFKTDQLGQAHVDVPDVGTSVCDIGALEFQPEG